MKDKYGSRKILHIICRQCLTQPEDPERPACFRFSFVVHGFLSQYLFLIFLCTCTVMFMAACDKSFQ